MIYQFLSRKIKRTILFFVCLASMLIGNINPAFSQVRTLTATSPGGTNYNFNPNAFYPPPVNAATINKGGDVNVNLASGTPNVGIPLFNIKSRFLNLPVTLNYASNGIKVNELAGIAGLGWSLNYGGVVNRTCFGLPDEERSSVQMNNFTKTTFSVDRPTLDYLNNAIDKESDVFDFSVNGMISGKFIFGNDGKAILLEDKNYKVVTSLSSIRNGIEIIDEKGIHYSFNVCDTSTFTKVGTYCADGAAGRAKKFGNAWYLSSIIQPGQDTITFQYMDNYHSYLVDVSETESIVMASTLWACTNGSSGFGCPKYSSTFDNCFTNQTINSKLLTQINFTNGYLRFDYNANDVIRKDITGGATLTDISLINNKGDIIRHAGFSFTYFKSPSFGTFLRNNGMLDSTLIYRLVLDKLNITQSFESTTPSYNYSFSYLQGNALPARLSGSQDFYGYNNGKDNPYLLTSITDQYPQSDYYLLGYPARFGDRTPDTKKMQYGLLNKVVYPTGGYDTITYDFNKTKEQYIDDHKAVYSAGVIGTGLNTVQENNGVITLPYKQTINVDFKVTSTDPNQPNTRNQGTLYIYSREQGDITVYTRTYMPLNNGQTASDIQLDSGTYDIRILSQGAVISSVVGIKYFSQKPETLYRDVPLGGVSVAAITNCDNITNTAVKKSYNYMYKEDGRYSTFRILKDPKYMQSSNIPAFISCTNTQDCLGSESCTYLVHTNNTNTPTTVSGSNTCYHESVIETVTGADNIDRSVEYRYKYNSILYPGVINGSIANTPYGILPDFLIGDTLTTYYAVDKNTANRTVQKIIKKTYEENYQRIVDNYNVKKVYTVPCQFEPPQPVEFGAYYINNYPIYFQQKKLLSTMETDYALNGNGYLQSSVTNNYNTTPYTLIKESISQSSKGETLNSAFKYYWELNSNALSDTIKNRNNIALPADVTASRNGNVQTHNTVDYKFQDNNNLIVQPYRYVTELAGQPLKTQYDITGFDPYGNVQEVVKDGFVNSYLWDYNSCLMVASTVNAGKQSVSYTSFEADNNGGWIVSGNQRNSTDAITGLYSYSLSSGSITQPALPLNVEYIITFWAKGGTVNINGVQATAKTQRMGWTEYEYKFTPVNNNLTIAGTALIDELRLYPSSAQMTTYTYAPLVGINSQCDAQNKIVYYSYDPLGRLKTITDQDGKIIKQYDYQYQATITQ
ncbi:hypothetical protein [Chitinophaga niastensis]|nr:hypothetical protein [Chitinophaga niastensis]